MLGLITFAVLVSSLPAGERVLASEAQGKGASGDADGALLARMPALLVDVQLEAAALRAADLRPTRESLSGASKAVADAIAQGAMRISTDGTVQLDLRILGLGPDAAALAGIDAVVEHRRPDLGRMQVRVPAWRLDQLAGLPGVRFLRLPSYALSAVGAAQTEGAAALRVDELREQFDLSGAGVRIGVISDGIDGLADAHASGDVPELAEVRAFGGKLSDGAEGVALLEIVHDLAPEATLSFASAGTDLDMIEAVDFLAERNDIVIDDLGFLFPDDQRSAVSLNTAAALNNPAWPIRAYITAAGNWALRHYQGTFLPGVEAQTLGVEFSGAVHRFTTAGGVVDHLARGPSHFNEIYLGTGDEVFLVLYWDDPWGASLNDYDLYLLNAQNLEMASSTRGQGSNADTPKETISFTNDGPAGFFRVVVHNFEDRSPPREIELFAFFTGTLPGAEVALNFNTQASSQLAQSDAGGGVIAVGTIQQANPGLSSIAAYSSRGPTNNGALKPDITAVDGIAVTGAGGFGVPFFGTSAAAPHVAAVAALLLELEPSLSATGGGSPAAERELLRKFLLEGAVDLGAPGADTTFGFGLLDAVLSAEAADTAIATIRSSADSGPGSLRAAIELLNAGEASVALVDPQLDAGLPVQLLSPLPALSGNDVTLDGGGLSLDASALGAAAAGLQLTGDGITLSGFRVQGAPGAGVLVHGDSIVLADLTLDGNLNGIVIEAGALAARVGTDGSGVHVINSGAEGIVIRGAGTRAAQVLNGRIGVDPTGVPAGNAGPGVLIADGAADNAIGPAATVAPALSTAQAPALAHTVVGVALVAGVPAPLGAVVEVLLDGESLGATTIGVVDVNGAAGFVLSLFGSGTTISFRVDGLDAAEELPFAAGSVSNVVLSVSTVSDAVTQVLAGGNVIAHNGGDGVRLEGAGTRRNTLRGNTIHSNAGKPLVLLGGANEGLGAPTITAAAFRGGVATVTGSAPHGSRVDLYVVVDMASDPDVFSTAGRGGALRFAGTTMSRGGQFSLDQLALGGAEVLTALRTDVQGNTSPFAANFNVGFPPRLEAVTPARGSVRGGDRVTLAGAGFVAGGRVFFGGAEATVLTVEPGALEVLTPGGADGAADVLIVSPNGRLARIADGYEYAQFRPVQLQPGWNNVTWGGGRVPITAAINALAGHVDRLFAWDLERQDYDRFLTSAPASLNTLTSLDPGQVLWLFLSGTNNRLWEQPLP